MDPARGRSDQPDDDFESIVASWRREGSVPDWPSDRPEPAGPTLQPGDRPVHRPGPSEAVEPDEEHYHPPEPPPLPRPGPPVVVGGGLILLGLLLCVTPGLLGAGGTWPLPLGLVLIAAGLTWLIMRLWTADPGEDDPDPYDDGSRL